MTSNKSLEDARKSFRRQLRPFAKKEATRCVCGSCQVTIPAELEWSCGYCGFANRRTNVYSFLNECQKCKKEPKAIICPECETVNYLDNDVDASHAAHKTIQAVRIPKPENPQISLDRDHKEHVAQLDREIEIAKKKASLRLVEDSLGKTPEKTDHEKAVEELVARARKILRFEAAAPDARVKLQEAFKGIPEFEGKIDEVLHVLISEQDGLK